MYGLFLFFLENDVKGVGAGQGESTVDNHVGVMWGVLCLSKGFGKAHRRTASCREGVSMVALDDKVVCTCELWEEVTSKMN